MPSFTPSRPLCVPEPPPLARTRARECIKDINPRSTALHQKRMSTADMRSATHAMNRDTNSSCTTASSTESNADSNTSADSEESPFNSGLVTPDDEDALISFDADTNFKQVDAKPVYDENARVLGEEEVYGEGFGSPFPSLTSLSVSTSIRLIPPLPRSPQTPRTPGTPTTRTPLVLRTPGTPRTPRTPQTAKHDTNEGEVYDNHQVDDTNIKSVFSKLSSSLPPQQDLSNNLDSPTSGGEPQDPFADEYAVRHEDGDGSDDDGMSVAEIREKTESKLARVVNKAKSFAKGLNRNSLVVKKDEVDVDGKEVLQNAENDDASYIKNADSPAAQVQVQVHQTSSSHGDASLQAHEQAQAPVKSQHEHEYGPLSPPRSLPSAPRLSPQPDENLESDVPADGTFECLLDAMGVQGVDGSIPLMTLPQPLCATTVEMQRTDTSDAQENVSICDDDQVPSSPSTIPPNTETANAKTNHNADDIDVALLPDAQEMTADEIRRGLRKYMVSNANGGLDGDGDGMGLSASASVFESSDEDVIGQDEGGYDEEEEGDSVYVSFSKDDEGDIVSPSGKRASRADTAQDSMLDLATALDPARIALDPFLTPQMATTSQMQLGPRPTHHPRDVTTDSQNASIYFISRTVLSLPLAFLTVTYLIPYTILIGSLILFSPTLIPRIPPPFQMGTTPIEKFAHWQQVATYHVLSFAAFLLLSVYACVSVVGLSPEGTVKLITSLLLVLGGGTWNAWGDWVCKGGVSGVVGVEDCVLGADVRVCLWLGVFGMGGVRVGVRGVGGRVRVGGEGAEGREDEGAKGKGKGKQRERQVGEEIPWGERFYLVEREEGECGSDGEEL